MLRHAEQHFHPVICNFTEARECFKRARVFAVYWTARGQVNVRAHKADDTSLRRQNSRPEALDKGLR